ncbi:AMP deaminase [Ranunculus cassubicifolius]
MAGGGFMARVLHYVINEALVNGLANSPTFQRFAVRTSKRIENVTNIVAKSKDKLAEQMEEMAKRKP